MTRAVTRAGEAGCGVEGEGVRGRRVRDGRAGRGAEWGEEEARLGGGYARRRGSGGGARFERARGWEKETRRGMATARGAGGRTHPYSGTRRWIRTSCTTATTATTAYAPASASNVRSCEEEEAGEQGQTDAPRGGGAPGEGPGAPFFSRSRAEASAAGTRLVVRVVGPGREERAARDAVGARMRGHGRNARLEEWARRVARNRRLSNHDRKNLPPRKWTRRPRAEKKQLARVASASLRPVQGKRPRSRRRHSPHSPRRHHVARTREDARRGGARG